MDQGGLGLPDRDYYTRDDAKSKEQRDEYQKHVAKMFELMGDPAATAGDRSPDGDGPGNAARQVFPDRGRAARPEKRLSSHAPIWPQDSGAELPLGELFHRGGLGGKGDVNVTAPDFFKEMGQMISAQPISNWKTYLRWHLINTAAPSLSHAVCG